MLKTRRGDKTSDNNIVHIDSLKRESPYRLGKNNFVTSDLEYINRAAYWDYQREKVYVRSSPQLKRISRRISHTHTKTPPVNKIVEYDLPSLGYCPKCKVKKLAKYGKRSKIVHDLRFDKTGIKRWIVKYVFQNYF